MICASPAPFGTPSTCRDQRVSCHPRIQAHKKRYFGWKEGRLQGREIGRLEAGFQAGWQRGRQRDFRQGMEAGRLGADGCKKDFRK